jgi:sulfide dehydrogenase cytochrome subunit
MKIAFCLGIAGLCALSFSFGTYAQDAGYARSLAATCFTCHGTDGRSVGGVPPALAGQERNYLLQQMQDFKSGKRTATIMHQHAKGYSDEQLQLIAGYFAAVKPGAPSAAPRDGGRP